MTTYMIVEDDPIKESAYRKFEHHYRDSGLRFRTRASAKAAITALQDPDIRAELTGVIADFDLGERRDTPYKRIDVEGPDGASYTISTGMGVLDWVHSVEPDMPLWALTSDSAAHAPLFMSAASLWLDAKPLSVDRFNQPGKPRADRLCDELLTPERYATLNPLWKRLDNARASYCELLNTPYGGEEAFDWLHALTHLQGSPRGFVPTLTSKIRQITLNQKLNVFAHTLAPVMAQWQLRLDEIYDEFPVNRDEDKWPQFDEDNLPKALSAWVDFNPIIGFLGDNAECKKFFHSPDVRKALEKWRARGGVV